MTEPSTQTSRASETAPAARSALVEPDDGLRIPPRHIVRGRRVVRGFLSLKWVPMTGALLALPLSAAALWVSLQQPQIMLIMPDQVRIVQGRESGSAYVYLQPSFVNTGGNNRVEVIRDMTLDVAGPTAAEFQWTQQVRLVGDGDGLSYEYAGDAAPIVVSANAASSMLGLFDAPSGWHFAPGVYTFTLRAERVVVAAPTEATFTVTLSAEEVAFLDAPGPDQFLAFPIDP